MAKRTRRGDKSAQRAGPASEQWVDAVQRSAANVNSPMRGIPGALLPETQRALAMLPYSTERKQLGELLMKSAATERCWLDQSGPPLGEFILPSTP